MDRKKKQYIIQTDFVFLKFNSNGILKIKIKDRKFDKNLTEKYDKYMNLRFIYNQSCDEVIKRWDSIESKKRNELARIRKNVVERDLISIVKNMY